MDPTDGGLISDIGDAQIRQVRFRYCLVNRFVLFDTAKEVLLGIFRRHVLVVRVTRAYFQCDICRNERRIIANGFEKNDNDALFLGYASFDLSSRALPVRENMTEIIMKFHLRARVLFVASMRHNQQLVPPTLEVRACSP